MAGLRSEVGPTAERDPKGWRRGWLRHSGGLTGAPFLGVGLGGLHTGVPH